MGVRAKVPVIKLNHQTWQCFWGQHADFQASSKTPVAKVAGCDGRGVEDLTTCWNRLNAFSWFGPVDVASWKVCGLWLETQKLKVHGRFRIGDVVQKLFGFNSISELLYHVQLFWNASSERGDSTVHPMRYTFLHECQAFPGPPPSQAGAVKIRAYLFNQIESWSNSIEVNFTSCPEKSSLENTHPVSLQLCSCQASPEPGAFPAAQPPKQAMNRWWKRWLFLDGKPILTTWDQDVNWLIDGWGGAVEMMSWCGCVSCVYAWAFKMHLQVRCACWRHKMEHQVFPPLQPEAGYLPSEGNWRFLHDFKGHLKLDVNLPISPKQKGINIKKQLDEAISLVTPWTLYLKLFNLQVAETQPPRYKVGKYPPEKTSNIGNWDLSWKLPSLGSISNCRFVSLVMIHPCIYPWIHSPIQLSTSSQSRAPKGVGWDVNVPWTWSNGRCYPRETQKLHNAKLSIFQDIKCG